MILVVILAFGITLSQFEYSKTPTAVLFVYFSVCLELEGRVSFVKIVLAGLPFPL